MISPVDQPPTPAVPRSTDPPTLWLSLVLGSVLIHLVLFILATLFLTRTATVELDPEPITVEFVDPNAVSAETATPSQAITARPGAPSASQPSATQAQPNTARSQAAEPNPPVEQPFVQPAQRRRLPDRIQPPQPQPSRNPVLPSSPPIPQPSEPPVNRPTQPPLNPTNRPLPPSPDLPDPGRTQPPSRSAQEGLPGALPDPSASSEPPSAGSPATGERIPQGPSGENVTVNIMSARQPSVDVLKQPAQPIDRQKAVPILYPPGLAKQTINLQARLIIDQNGQMVEVKGATLLSSGAIDQETLKELARQIFTQWQFTPAQDNVDGKLVKPLQSNLVIEAQIQLP